jgi:hypothetical protein
MARLDNNGDETLGFVNRPSVVWGSIVSCWINEFNYRLFNYFAVADMR